MRGVATSCGSMIARGNTSEVYAIGVDAIVKVPRPDVPPRWVDMKRCTLPLFHAVGLPTPMVGGETSVARGDHVTFIVAGATHFFDPDGDRLDADL